MSILIILLYIGCLLRALFVFFGQGHTIKCIFIFHKLFLHHYNTQLVVKWLFDHLNYDIQNDWYVQQQIYWWQHWSWFLEIIMITEISNSFKKRGVLFLSKKFLSSKGRETTKYQQELIGKISQSNCQHAWKQNTRKIRWYHFTMKYLSSRA